MPGDTSLVRAELYTDLKFRVGLWIQTFGSPGGHCGGGAHIVFGWRLGGFHCVPLFLHFRFLALLCVIFANGKKREMPKVTWHPQPEQRGPTGGAFVLTAHRTGRLSDVVAANCVSVL